MEGKFLSGVKLVSILSSFSLTSCLTKAKNPSLPYYFQIPGEENGSMPFPSDKQIYI